MKGLLIVMVSVSVLLAAGVTWATEPKIGIVDLQSALNDSKAGKAARAQFVDEMEKLQEKLRKEKDDLDNMREDFDKKAMLLREKERVVKQQEIEDRGVAFKRKYEDYQRQLKRKDNEYTGAILRDLQAVIREVGEREGYSLILESQSSGLLYGSPTMDLTAEIVRTYNTSTGKKNKKQ